VARPDPEDVNPPDKSPIELKKEYLSISNKAWESIRTLVELGLKSAEPELVKAALDVISNS
jgi:hypothetical protein